MLLSGVGPVSLSQGCRKVLVLVIEVCAPVIVSSQGTLCGACCWPLRFRPPSPLKNSVKLSCTRCSLVRWSSLPGEAHIPVYFHISCFCSCSHSFSFFRRAKWAWLCLARIASRRAQRARSDEGLNEQEEWQASVEAMQHAIRQAGLSQRFMREALSMLGTAGPY